MRSRSRTCKLVRIRTLVRAHTHQVERIERTLPKLHALVIGPGLGRDPNVLAAVARVISAARQHKVPLVIDADGFVHSFVRVRL